MAETPQREFEVSRITCVVHPRLGAQVVECLGALGAHTLLVENARSVRLRIRGGIGPLPARRTLVENAPMELFRTTVPRSAAAHVMRALTDALELSSPGRGTLFSQNLREFSRLVPPEIQTVEEPKPPGVRDLCLMTGILSRVNGGERLAAAALRLGACVPIVTLGTGTGIRDQLGLLRVTIPPEKELVHLMVPAADAAGIRRLLIDEARLNRPGGGFLYQTPVHTGMADPLMRIGRQEHAASIEQLIAAMDEMKRGTTWRKRFSELEEDAQGGVRLQVGRDHREISLICSEGNADDFVRAAMQAGAGGATTSRQRCLRGGEVDAGAGARERVLLCVPASASEPLVQCLLETAQKLDDPLCRLQILEAPAVFYHQR